MAHTDRSVVGVGIVLGMVITAIAVYLMSTQYAPLTHAETVGKKSDDMYGLTRVSASGDGQGPVITRETPTHDVVLQSGATGMLDIRATASDPDGIARMTFLLDSVEIKTCLNMHRCDTTLSVAGITQGAHVVTIRASDIYDMTQSVDTRILRDVLE